MGRAFPFRCAERHVAAKPVPLRFVSKRGVFSHPVMPDLRGTEYWAELQPNDTGCRSSQLVSLSLCAGRAARPVAKPVLFFLIRDSVTCQESKRSKLSTSEKTTLLRLSSRIH